MFGLGVCVEWCSPLKSDRPSLYSLKSLRNSGFSVWSTSSSGQTQYTQVMVHIGKHKKVRKKIIHVKGPVQLWYTKKADKMYKWSVQKRTCHTDTVGTCVVEINSGLTNSFKCVIFTFGEMRVRERGRLVFRAFFYFFVLFYKKRSV